MKFLSNFKISSRMWMLAGALSALLVAVGSVGPFGIRKSNDAIKTVYEDRTVAAGQLADIAYLLQRNRVLVMDMMLANAPTNIDTRSSELQDNQQKLGKLW